MYIRLTSRFRRELKKMPVELRELINERVDHFINDPFKTVLKTHKLSGKFKGHWAFSIDYKHRIIFEFIEDYALFHSIGDHSIYDY